jgi:hypothetical protein
MLGNMHLARKGTALLSRFFTHRAPKHSLARFIPADPINRVLCILVLSGSCVGFVLDEYTKRVCQQIKLEGEREIEEIELEGQRELEKFKREMGVATKRAAKRQS